MANTSRKIARQLARQAAPAGNGVGLAALKAEAYDAIAQVEWWQGRLRQLNAAIGQAQGQHVPLRGAGAAAPDEAQPA